ncbi:isocitrate/isopropylmalate dehydrogenase family protein [Streptococcus moroccensis]|uniref:Isocitrate dehydrogenase (NAD+) n=1 Tax=Streptococcus moroccensis TaxID=1451356 RepID=A0ABT9YTG5_9STRE|nr:isocitrate/isopropylmalate family dehydrogenase [Streptococcus moroccensis]MDQ0223287.1 isocitrate dehydrogenase (NAD+) [Streptococcus moroccensis]
MQKVTLIPGDGIGPEIAESLKEIFAAAKVPIQFDQVEAGQAILDQTGSLVPDNVYQKIEENKIAIKGPITTPIGQGFRSINVSLRKKYDLYANVRPVKSIPGLTTRYQDIDLVIFRENTEGLYIGEEHYETDDHNSAVAIKRITKQGSERIVKSAFEHAKKHGQTKVTVVHKANILKLTDGLFLETAREVATSYPNITMEELIVDNMCLQLVTHPERFQVIVTMNLYGDILSDLCAGLVGGLGIAPGANLGDDLAIFEAVHGSAPDIAGQDKANPLALIYSGINMLDYMGLSDYARQIENAVLKTVSQPEHRTADLGGQLATSAFTQKVINYL